MGTIFNIDDDLPVYLKHQYQEGTATGLTVTGSKNKIMIWFCFQLKGRDGEVRAETIVPMFKARFMAISILTNMRASDWSVGDEVVLDYRRFETSTLKIFMDALYNCNVGPIPLPEILKLLQFMSKFGFTETIQGKEDFPCTIKEWVRYFYKLGRNWFLSR